MEIMNVMENRSKPNQLKEISQQKSQIVDLAEKGVTSSHLFSPAEAALMFGIPGRVLKESAVSITPRRQGVEVAVGSNPDQHLDNITDWLRDNRAESQELLEEGYKLLFLAGQASGIPSVNFKQIIESEGPRMKVLESIVPEIKDLKEHLNQGGRVQDLIREDKDYWGGLVHACYQNLSRHQQEGLKSKGMSPENMFQTSGG